MNTEVLHANPDNSSLSLARSSFVESLRNQRRTVAIVEGCTGGALNDAITIPGATRIISGGVAPYSRESKVILGVPLALINTYGENSIEVARFMAMLSQQKDGVDLGIGVAGNPESNGPVAAAYMVRGRGVFEDIFTVSATEQRRMNNEITVRVLTTANALLQGQRPRLDVPVIGEPADIFADEQKSAIKQAESVIQLCRDLGLTLGTMESCTGLSLANNLTNVLGSRGVFQIGFLAYNENVKKQLGVPFEVMLRGGVYSKHVAARMAEGVIEKTGVDVGFATTGVLDVWDTRTYHQEVPPGTVSLAIAQKGKPTWSETRQFTVETRDKMKLAVASAAFETFLSLNAGHYSVHRTFKHVTNL